MKKRFSQPAWMCFVAAFFGLALSAFAANSPRQAVSLDRDWRFQIEDATNVMADSFDDSHWRHVDVPHDYVVEGAFDPTNHFRYPGMNASWYSLHAFLPVQPAVYRKTFSIPSSAKGKRLWLEFDGVFSNSRYWLNGQEIGSQYSGYTRSRFDITDATRFGAKNALAVRVDPRYDGWWYEGGGIYRHVRLVIANPVHIAPDGVFVSAAVANPRDGAQSDATIAASVEVTNATAQRPLFRQRSKAKFSTPAAIALPATQPFSPFPPEPPRKSRRPSRSPKPGFGRLTLPIYINCAARFLFLARSSIN
jgi:beta-galactosidase/beta-glucuronidase